MEWGWGESGDMRWMRDAEFRPDAGCGVGMRDAGKCDAGYERRENAMRDADTAVAVLASRIALSRIPNPNPASRIGPKFRIPHPSRHSLLHPHRTH
jgi:hypothetical protein